MKTQRRSRFTHPLQALSAEFSIIVWFAAVIAQGENTKTKPIHAPSSGFPVLEFGIIILFADVRAQVWLKSVQSSTRVRMGPSSSMAALLPLPSLSSERQSSSSAWTAILSALEMVADDDDDVPGRLLQPLFIAINALLSRSGICRKYALFWSPF